MILILLNNSLDSPNIHFLYLLSVKIIPLSSSLALWRNFFKFAILAEFARFVKIAASLVPLSRAQSAKLCQIGHSRRIRRIRRNSCFAGSSLSSSIALRRNFVKLAILAEFAGFVEIAASPVLLSRAQSLLGKISSNLLFSSNSPDSLKSPLRRYPYLDLNCSSAKVRQIRHSQRIHRK